MTFALLGFALVAAVASQHVSAQSATYPVRPVRLIVPFAPGGGTDASARLIAQKLTESFAKSVVVDNRAGGGGTVGVETAVNATPDGYTMLLISASYATNAAIYKLPYDAVNDITPVTQVFDSATVVALHPSIPVMSVKELIAYAKAKPAALNYGSSGTGGITHLSTELFDQLAGTRMTHVPYRGTGPAMNDLLGGQIQLIFGAVASVMPHVNAKRLRGIAVTSAKRSIGAPELPPVAETVPGYEAAIWYGVVGPKGLPKQIVQRWNTEIDRIIGLPEMKERMIREGFERVEVSPARFHELLKREVSKWNTVVKKGNIRAET
ncbi:MAG TPA: tripartite tricarboxylate transporter substrate binding protein [Burkholderiales bacterium]|nr:tripartite tricarboxylate transporter substrate binding protein [Burkholderiales bacterium]